MFYFEEIAALLICWLFYCEFYWMIERKVLKTCSRQYVDKRCGTLAGRLFFTPVSGKAGLGSYYYINKFLVLGLSVFTAFHLLLGWIEEAQGFIRVLTTILIVVLGIVAVIHSSSATEQVCANANLSSRKIVLLLKIISVFSEIFLILVYLYFAWCYIG